MEPTLYSEPNDFDSIALRWLAREKECPIVFRTIQSWEITIDALPCFIDHDLHIVEHGAIVSYLFERYPGVSLLPADPKIRAQLRQMCMMVRRGLDDFVAQIGKMVCHGNTWVAGEEFTIADIYIGTQIVASEEDLPEGHVLDYYWRLKDRPAFKEAMS